ncbi:MAG: hypothetical protein Q9186_000682 [Xanthomendoza sp. 1 TL-2023]
MAISMFPLRILAAFATFHVSTQLTITLEWWPRGTLERFQGGFFGKCNNIPPGDCCKPHRGFLPPPAEIGASVVSFGTLLHNQFGAGWGASGPEYEDIPECTGIPILRVFGPETDAIYQTPNFPDILDIVESPDNDGLDITPDRASMSSEDSASGEPHEIVFSAAWIDLRTRFPPDPAGTRYLRYQGVNSLIWGQNTWSAGSDGIPFPKRDGEAKLNQWARRGEATIHRPRRWRYPDSYTINGTEYTNRGDGLYKDSEGAMLNLTN